MKAKKINYIVGGLAVLEKDFDSQSRRQTESIGYTGREKKAEEIKSTTRNTEISKR